MVTATDSQPSKTTVLAPRGCVVAFIPENYSPSRGKMWSDFSLNPSPRTLGKIQTCLELLLIAGGGVFFNALSDFNSCLTTHLRMNKFLTSSDCSSNQELYKNTFSSSVTKTFNNFTTNYLCRRCISLRTTNSK